MRLAQRETAALLAPSNGRRCLLCGQSISSPPYGREGDGYCCESCYLHRQGFGGLEADNTYLALAEALATALDAREQETGLHSRRVACLTLILARHFTDEPEQLRQIYWGALLHDLGKIGIPEGVLCNPAPLTEDEQATLRTHPEIGHRILATIPFMEQAAEIVLNHEERFDGSGYPCGLGGKAIPLWARLFAVADTLDAATSDRHCRKSVSFDAAKAEIQRLSGSRFDPQAVEVFLAEEARMREMVSLKCGAAVLPV